MEQKQSRELATVLGAASEQIGLALIDSCSAVEKLCTTLERVAGLLAEDLTRPGSAAKIAQLRGEIDEAVNALQFYDRMTQHLSHVREYLNGTVGQLQSAQGTFETLNRRLADRLLSDTHRIHLSKDLSAEFLARTGIIRKPRSDKGDVDLF